MSCKRAHAHAPQPRAQNAFQSHWVVHVRKGRWCNNVADIHTSCGGLAATARLEELRWMQVQPLRVVRGVIRRGGGWCLRHVLEPRLRAYRMRVARS